MPYHVEIDEAVVLNYLRDPDRGLAEADIDTLLDFLEGLAHTGEVYRNEPSRRLSPGSPNFEVAYIFQDAAGRLRNVKAQRSRPCQTVTLRKPLVGPRSAVAILLGRGLIRPSVAREQADSTHR